jgi:hypothetical protein
MRIRELFDSDDKVYVPKISVYLDGAEREDKDEVAGMLHDLMCSIEGWGEVSGLTNEVPSAGGPMIFPFSTVDNAHYFKNCAEYYFDGGPLVGLTVKNRVCCATH